MIGEGVKVEEEEEEDGKKKKRKNFVQYLLDLKDSEGPDSKTPFTMTHVKALLMVLFLTSLSNFITFFASPFWISFLKSKLFLEFYLFFLKQL